MKKHKTVGKCSYCKDPIYNFQKEVDGMHKGCAKLRNDSKTKTE